MLTIEFSAPHTFVWSHVLRSWNVNIKLVDESVVRGRVEGFVVGELSEKEVLYVSPIEAVAERQISEPEIQRIEVVSENYY